MMLADRKTIVSIAGACVLVVARGAYAQEDADVAARRVFLEQAQQARQGGNHTAALEHAQRAGRIQMTPSLRLFIAQENQSLGRIGEAYGGAELCVREVERDPAVNNRDVILAACREIVGTLRGRIAVITLRVPNPRPNGLSIRVAGAVVPESAFDGPYVVGAGAVTIEAAAAGQAPFRREITLAPGASEDVQIALQPGTAASGMDRGASAAPATPQGASRRASVPIGGIVVGGVGVATLGAGLAFFVARNGALGNCTLMPEQITCPTADDAMRAEGGRTFNTLTNVFVPAGAILTAAGVAWVVAGLVTSGSHARPATAVFSRFQFGPIATGFGLSLGGEL